MHENRYLCGAPRSMIHIRGEKTKRRASSSAGKPYLVESMKEGASQAPRRIGTIQNQIK